MEGSEALARVALHAAGDDVFREAWDAAVRDGADIVTASVAGGRMAGRTRGEVGWDAAIPCPPGMDGDDAELAYRHAVRAEVTRRLEATAWGVPPGGIRDA